MGHFAKTFGRFANIIDVDFPAPESNIDTYPQPGSMLSVE
jgi:hypothetical protein